MPLGIIKGRAGVDLLSKKRKARFKQGLSKVLRGGVVFPFIIPCRSGRHQEPPQVRVLSFTIGFDEAQTFYKSHGYGIKPSKWHDLTVEVYI